MSPKTLIQEYIQETDSTQQSQKAVVEDSQESKKSHTADEIVPQDKAEEAEEEEEGGRAAPAAAPRSGRERLKRHRVEVAGRVWIPDMWGHEQLLKDWADCASFDASLVRSTILLARDSLAKEAARTTPLSPQLRLRHTC